MPSFIAKQSIQLLLKDPLFGALALGVLKNTDPEIPFLGLKSTPDYLIQLCFNEESWNKSSLSDPQKLGGIKHELLHLVLFHVFKVRITSHPWLYFIASDFEANQYLEKEELENDALTIDCFPELALEKGQNSDFYYRQLKKHFEKKSSLDSWPEALHPEHFQLKKHLYWNRSFIDVSTSAIGLLQSNIENWLRRTLVSLDKESFQGVSKKLFEDIQFNFTPKPITISWKRELRLFAHSASKTVIKNTIHKPSKRYGSVPGIKLKRQKKILIAIDVSASIHEQDWQAFFSEIYGVWRTGAAVQVVECDDEIRTSYVYSGHHPLFLKGGGGTEYDEPIKMANADLSLNGLIYFTDGEGQRPKEMSTIPLLWVISEAGIKVDSFAWNNLPGRKIKIV